MGPKIQPLKVRETEMINLSKLKRVLIFGAHGDDEILGPGATISWMAANGIDVFVVTFTFRETAYADVALKDKMINLTKQEMRAADKVLGIKRRIGLGVPNQAVTNNRETFQKCVKIVRQIRPEIIFTHNPTDIHRDHRAVSLIVDEARQKAAENVLADFGHPWHTSQLFYFEISNLFSHPSLIISFPKKFLEKKVEAMKTQVTQLDVLKGVENQIRGLAMFRGAQAKWLAGIEKNQVGTDYGEAFKLSDFHFDFISLP